MHALSSLQPSHLHQQHTMITFFDAVPTEKEVSPYFSPFTARARLALLQKGVPFETQDVTYHDLRFEWTPKLGVEAATGKREGLRC